MSLIRDVFSLCHKSILYYQSHEAVMHLDQSSQRLVDTIIRHASLDFSRLMSDIHAVRISIFLLVESSLAIPSTASSNAKKNTIASRL